MKPALMTVQLVRSGPPRCTATLVGDRWHAAQVGSRLGAQVVVLAPPEPSAAAGAAEQLWRVALLCLEQGWSPQDVELTRPGRDLPLPVLRLDFEGLFGWLETYCEDDAPPELRRRRPDGSEYTRLQLDLHQVTVEVLASEDELGRLDALLERCRS